DEVSTVRRAVREFSDVVLVAPTGCRPPRLASCHAPQSLFHCLTIPTSIIWNWVLHHTHLISTLLLSKDAYGSRVPRRGHTMKKPKRSRKATKSPKRTKAAVKPVKKTKVAPVVPAATRATEPTAAPVARSKAARASIAEGTRLFALAGCPTKQQ